MDQPKPEETAVSPARALRVELARAAERTFGLSLRVTGIRQSRMDLADTVERIDPDWALYPLLHEDGSTGACVLSRECVFALVEQQTLGILAEVPPLDRVPTHTDKALAYPLIENFLHRFDLALEGAPTAFWTLGYRCYDAVATKHLLALQLDAAEFRVFEVNVTFLPSQRTAALKFLLPIKSRPEPPKPQKSKKKGQVKEEKQSLRSSALPAAIPMRAVMCRMQLQLSELRNMQVDQVFQLPRNAMDRACIEDRRAKTSIPVRLGQLNGVRAVRLRHPVSSEQGSLAAQNNDEAMQESALLSAFEDEANSGHVPNALTMPSSVKAFSNGNENDHGSSFDGRSSPEMGGQDVSPPSFASQDVLGQDLTAGALDADEHDMAQHGSPSSPMTFGDDSEDAFATASDLRELDSSVTAASTDALADAELDALLNDP